jgi:hypothetical protein
MRCNTPAAIGTLLIAGNGLDLKRHTNQLRKLIEAVPYRFGFFGPF